MMLTLLVKFVASRGSETALQRALQTLAESSRREAGCNSFEPYRVPDAPGQFVLYERWRDDTALSEHNQGPSVRRFRELLPSLIASDPEVSMLDLIEP